MKNKEEEKERGVTIKNLYYLNVEKPYRVLL
jgi:hypothetical protein